MPRKTDEETAQLALTALVITGSARAASRMLAADGVNIAESTIRSLKESRPDEYEQIRSGKAGELRDRLLADLDGNLVAMQKVMEDTIQKVHQYVRTGKGKDYSSVLQRVATTYGILTDKKALMKGEPTQIVHDTSGENVMKRLERYRELGLVDFVDSTADEVQPAQLAASNGNLN